jgi:hypothetical protein
MFPTSSVSIDRHHQARGLDLVAVVGPPQPVDADSGRVLPLFKGTGITFECSAKFGSH